MRNVKNINGDVMKKLSSWKFGDTTKEADSLVNLVISGKKKATSSLYLSYLKNPIPKVGDKSIIKDSKNSPKCIVETTKVTIKPFGKITNAFALKEGEGDLSLSYWRKVHKKFFEKRLKKMKRKFNPEILIVCEEFKLLKNL